MELAVKVYQRLEQVISRYLGGKKPFLGGSYGWAAPSDDPDVVLQLMAQAVEECGCADKMAYCLDCASSEMYDRHTDTYLYGSRRVSREELIDHAAELIRKYPILFIEDLLAEDDWDGFVQAHQKLKGVKLIGDDFIVTNRRRLQKAYERHALDGFILKPTRWAPSLRPWILTPTPRATVCLPSPRLFRRGCGRYCGRLGAGPGGAHFQKWGTQVRRAAGQNQLPAPRQ